MNNLKILFEGIAWLGLLGFLLGGRSFVVNDFPIVPSGSAGILIFIFAASTRYLLFKKEKELNPLSFLLAIIFLLSSTYTQDLFSFFQGGVSLTGLLLIIIFAGILNFVPRSFPYLLGLGTLALSVLFYFKSGGSLLYSDDHPSFLYRFIQLKENFPYIPFYNPEWNAGVDAREFFPSGALSYFIIFSPLFYLANVESVYNLSIVLFLFFLLPGVLYYSAIVFGLNTRAASIAAILALSSSVLWYRWVLSYGTLGYCLSTALLPLAAVWLSKFKADESFSKKESLLFPFLFLLICLWPLGAILILPLAILLLLEPRKLFNKRFLFLSFLAAGILYFIWALSFISVSPVLSFLVSEGTEHASNHMSGVASARGAVGGDLMTKCLGVLRTFTTTMHPLLFLAVPFLFRKTYRTFGVLSIWLFLLGTAGLAFFPHLEFDRFLISLGLVLVIPCAGVLEDALSFLTKKRFGAFANIALISILISGFWMNSRVLFGYGSERFHFRGKIVDELKEALKEHAGSGRILFTGFILHDLSHGHIAPLAREVAKPIVASSYQHDKWKYTDVVPEDFREKGVRGVFRYYDLMNADTIVAFEPFWRRWLKSKKKRVELVWAKGKWAIFKRLNYENSYVLEGRLENLKELPRGIQLTPLTSDLIIKYRYYPFLRSSGCKLSSHDAGSDIQFIHLKDCAPGEPITIESIPLYQRISEAWIKNF